MDPYRVCLIVKIKEGNEDDFLTLIPQFIETIKRSEPHALQFEAFFNREKSELAWLQSYERATGFDEHIANLEIKELRRKMMPLREAILDLYLMGQPTQATINSLDTFDIMPKILDPWPGTLRLTETRDDTNNIQSLVAVELTDLDAYRDLSQKVEAAALIQPGIAFHRSYQSGPNSIIAFEEYANDKAILDWVKVFAATADNFGSLVKSMTYNVFGNPTGQCKQTLDAWGAIYFNKIAGFTRFN